MPLIQISQVAGLSDAQKAEAIEAVTRAYADSTGKSASSVWVVMNDVPASSWGVGGSPLG
ncbi:4-oxalocrotonate tautomerase family protein [Rothia sp. AR01]|uniref:4-oxalocrotonate tautomerase family protein n=1 Tax=Rothia santali TaxID=2949643 RepID=A0A9X2HCQ4_9MICC|nr:4-oxalocrotonate tautomerase family protein [Rothia santali]MCP3424714.1 4-oxalocrotonate tautomerase family protein [Rothia santali]